MANDNFAVALTRCFFCNGDAEILMNMRLTPGCAAKVRDADKKVINMQPCNQCKEYMAAGVILITIDDEKSERGWNRPPPGEDGRGFMPNPYRTGGFFVLRDEAVRRIFDGGEEAT